MSNSVRPQRWQPTRLPQPWDSPGKNTGVGCHFLFQSMKVKSESEVAQSCLTPSDPMDCSLPGSSNPWDFPGKSTGVGCHCLLCHMRVQWKDSHMQPGRGPLPLQFGSTLISPASKTMRNKFLLFTSHSIYDIFLEEPKLSIYIFKFRNN